MKKVMVFGTFDLFHKGHESYLKQAREHGDYVIAVVARDETVEKVKGRLPDDDEKTRLKRIKNSRLVDEAILGNKGKAVDKYLMIRKYRPDVICLGYDQISFIDSLQDRLKEFGLAGTKVVRLKAYKPHVFKSSKIREQKRK